MTEIVPESAPEPAFVASKRRMPGWALALCVAIAATCTATAGIVLTIRDENAYHRDVYNNCLAASVGLAKIDDAFAKLRNSDAEVLAQAKAVPPVTGYGHINLHGIEQRVEADDELLGQLKAPDCSRLK